MFKTKKQIISTLAALVFSTSCAQEVEKKRTQQTDLFAKTNKALNDSSYFTVKNNTVIKDADGISCQLYKDEKVYFSYFDEEHGIIEIALAQPIDGCEIKSRGYVSLQDIELNIKAPVAVNDTLDSENTNKKPEEGNVYESSDGFGGYDGPVIGKEFFPLSQYPLASYKIEGREFGASRAGGRKHAANDLLEYAGQAVFAVTDGEIIDYYYFYSGTYAIVVDHGAYVVRYGEVKGMASGLKVGSKVKAGDVIGSVGKLYSGYSMLHFEKYTGSLTGNLTVRSNYPYQRRNDLVRPTEFLDKLLGSYPR